MVMGFANPLGIEEVGLEEVLDRVIAEDIVSDVDMPPFNKSAMDGFACRRADLANDLDLIEEIPAGKVPERMISKDQCSRIMTGAMVPEGADCVIMVEETEIVESSKIRFTGTKTSDNICLIGEDVKISDVVLKQGVKIKPQHIAILASVGAVKLKVFKRPSVGVISTGDELVEPDQKPELSQIRNSNAYQIIAQIKAAGTLPDYQGIASDNIQSTQGKIMKSLDRNDVTILTGGVSMGEYDLVPDIMKDMGIQLMFQRIAIQPGKPTIFGKKGNKLCFGLPGNPVSSFVLFELLVKPLLQGLMGNNYSPANINLPMATMYSRKKSHRKSWLPVLINKDGEIETVEYHGSAHIYSLSDAMGLISIPIGETTLQKGEIVHVRLI